ncbi:MAG: NAD(P)-binding protein [Calditrichaeota bacterium]|nr:NAD(P)-binding protein [Calditrichota bacterium]
MAKEIIIVGGGLAGLSAALEALEHGLRPIVLEKSYALGGRARSVFARDVKETIDHGQHLLAASFEHTIWLLKKLNTLDYVRFQKRLFVHYVFPEGHSIPFRTWPFPPPFHFLIPLLLRREIPWDEKGFLLKSGAKVFTQSETRIESLTVPEWLRFPQSQTFLKRMLWEPLTLAILNTPLEQASALLLRNAFRIAFLNSSRLSGLGFPARPLQQIFGDPAKEFIQRHGGSVYLRTHIRRLVIEKNRVKAVIGPQGKVFETPAVILALPPDTLGVLLHPLASHFPTLWQSLTSMRYSPIVTINLWTRQPISHPFPMAFVDSPFHWLIALPWMKVQSGLYGYTVVSSAADDLAQQPVEAIMDGLNQELRKRLGLDLIRDLQCVKYKVIKEKRATIRQTPEANAARPSCVTPVTNLFLAGDWIQTGLPATIESAVFSGRQAVKKALHFMEHQSETG